MQVKSSEWNGLSPYLRYAHNPVRDNWSVGPRILRDYLLFLVESGRGTLVIEGREIQLRPGEWYWVPPGKKVFMEGVAPPRMRVPYVHFDIVYKARYAGLPVTEPGFLDSKHPSIQPDLFGGPPLCFAGKIVPHVFSDARKQLYEIITLYNNHSPFFRLKTSALLLELIANFADGAEFQSTEVAVVKKIEKLFEKNDLRSYTLQELGLITGYNALYVGRLFRRQKGLSPKQFQLRQRINKAKEMVRHSTLTFTAIAEKCGFDSLASFSRSFRRCENVSPTQYLRGPSNRHAPKGTKISS